MMIVAIFEQNRSIRYKKKLSAESSSLDDFSQNVRIAVLGQQSQNRHSPISAPKSLPD